MAALIHTYYQCSFCSQFYNSLDDFRAHICAFQKRAIEEQNAPVISLSCEPQVTEESPIGDIKFSWSAASTRLLLLIRHEMNHLFHSPPCKKKKLWKQVATKMMSRGGFRVSADICDKKWRNLICTYRRISDQNKKKENFHSHWDHFRQMQIIFEETFPDPEEKSYILEENQSISQDSNIILEDKPGLFDEKSGVSFPLTSCLLQPLKIDTDPLVPNQPLISDDTRIPEELPPNDPSPSNESFKELKSDSPPSWFIMYLDELREQERRKRLVKEKHWQEYKELQERKLSALLNLTQMLSEFIPAKHFKK